VAKEAVRSSHLRFGIGILLLPIVPRIEANALLFMDHYPDCDPFEATRNRANIHFDGWTQTGALLPAPHG
jgi:hypothetical protein